MKQGLISTYTLCTPNVRLFGWPVITTVRTLVMQLIKAGADVNTKSISDGTSALVMAVGRGYEACVALLINAGADVSERTLITVAQYPCTTNILKMLEDARSR